MPPALVEWRLRRQSGLAARRRWARVHGRAGVVVGDGVDEEEALEVDDGCSDHLEGHVQLDELGQLEEVVPLQHVLLLHRQRARPHHLGPSLLDATTTTTATATAGGVVARELDGGLAVDVVDEGRKGAPVALLLAGTQGLPGGHQPRPPVRGLPEPPHPRQQQQEAENLKPSPKHKFVIPKSADRFGNGFQILFYFVFFPVDGAELLLLVGRDRTGEHERARVRGGGPGRGAPA